MILGTLTTVLCAISAAHVGALGSTHGPLSRRQHHGIARASFSDEVQGGDNSSVILNSRGPNSKWSWYDTEESGNAGACGDHMKNWEPVVARAQVDFKPSDCGKRITLEFEGRTMQARIMDICPICPSNGLDLSKGLFKQIAPRGDGIVYGNWWFGGDAPKPPPTTSKEKPKPKPTSTTEEWTSTRTQTRKASSTTTRPPSTTPSETSTTTTTTTAALTEPTPTGNIATLQRVLVGLGGMVAGGAA